MTVCVVGSGGREHALARLLARSDDVVVTPGNPGMPAVLGAHTITVSPAPPEEIAPRLTVIGAEGPLVDGLADRLRARGMAVVGPGADGARLEGSKAFMKEILDEAGVPTARYGVFDNPIEAHRFLATLEPPYVVKTDGLAAGKGVLVTQSIDEAKADVTQKLSGRSFGQAGRRVVIEEGLIGVECSIHALCDGTRVVPFGVARDFKRVGDGDLGPNTGGMGSYSPPGDVDEALVDVVIDEAVFPVVATLARRGIQYRGILYAGVMMTAQGPYILEFNVRFGDPEAQVVLPRLTDDPLDLLTSVAHGRLGAAPQFTSDSSVCVVAAAKGYPESSELGARIEGLGPDGQLARHLAGTTVFHAGTARPDDGIFRVHGGRVLGLHALGPTTAEARARAYSAVAMVNWPGMQVRSDIALESGRTG